MFKLNKKQLEIINYNNGSVNVVAGPGTGKTIVLINRVKYLIKKGVDPSNILILSFNQSVVQEIKKFFSFKIKILTFHGLGTYFLKKHIFFLKTKYNNNFEIMDSFKVERVLKKVLKSDFRFLKYDISFPEIQNIISKLKNGLIFFDDIKNKDFLLFFSKYLKYLEEHNLIDFDDLIKYSVQLLIENKDILTIYQNKYSYIFVDEIQDINFYQYQFIKLLAKKSTLFIVGDINQNIYGFRGSNNIYIDLLKYDFHMFTFYLKINYRSCFNIVFIANKLISVMHSLKTRENYFLQPYLKKSKNIFHYIFEDSFSEVGFLIYSIKKLINEYHYQYSDICILYRKSYLLKYLKEKFLIAKIPFCFISEQQKFKKIGFVSSELKEFKKELQFLRDSYKSDLNKVLFSTFHQVKGLEFKAVFIIGLEYEIFIDNFFHKEIINQSEEDRLFYVAMTRAKERLYFTSVKKRYIYGYEYNLTPFFKIK